MSPTNGDELKCLILELQAARTQIALTLYQQIQGGKIKSLPGPLKVNSYPISDWVLVHVETNLSPSELGVILKDLIATPALQNTVFLVTSPEDGVSISGLSEVELREILEKRNKS